MGRIEKCWWDLVGKLPKLAYVKIDLKKVPRNLSIAETKLIILEKLIKG